MFFVFEIIINAFLRKLYLKKHFLSYIYFTYSGIIEIWKCWIQNRTSMVTFAKLSEMWWQCVISDEFFKNIYLLFSANIFKSFVLSISGGRYFHLGVFFLFCHMNVQHFKIIVLTFEVDWSKTKEGMEL